VSATHPNPSPVFYHVELIHGDTAPGAIMIAATIEATTDAMHTAAAHGWMASQTVQMPAPPGRLPV